MSLRILHLAHACTLSIFAFFAALIVQGSVCAQEPVPHLAGHVTDLVGVLSDQQRTSLEDSLAAFEARKGSQITVLVLASTKPEEIEQYSLRVVEAWKLGRKKVDDGALLLVATGDRRVRIEVGYGLEGALSDLKSKRIIDEIILPEFRAGRVADGIEAGVAAILRVVDGEELPAPKPREEGADSLNLLFDFIVLGLIVSSVARAIFPSAGAFLGTLLVTLISLLALPLVLVLLLFFILSLASLFAPRGIYPGHMRFGGGGFRGGGGFGGGFSGGGGSFGGGGASGRW